MSDTDSFIDEVSEEVRRDKLFVILRRYGWIGVAVVILLVGGAAFNEWKKSQARAIAQSAGDKILSALEVSDADGRAIALAELPGDQVPAGLLELLGSSESLLAEDKPGAIEKLRDLAANGQVSTAYSHLAELKLLLIESAELPVEQRLARLEPLAVPGAPYRLLAEEQIGLAQIAGGNTSTALDLLRSILLDTEVTPGQRRRVGQLIIALGGDTDPA